VPSAANLASTRADCIRTSGTADEHSAAVTLQ
jgi:hypothetical protein